MFVTAGDWLGWHDSYDREGSSLARRLAVVRRRVAEALDAAPPGPVTAVSMCAGQGRDLLGVLADHPRRGDVRALLVELDPRNAVVAERTARAAGLAGVEVLVGDASPTDTYANHVPADLVLACGVFGNISDEDVRATVDHLPGFCRRGATVVWTRHTGPPDLTPTIREWFAANGFELVAFDSEPGHHYGVGTHRLVGEPAPFRPGVRLFTFAPGPRG